MTRLHTDPVGVAEAPSAVPCCLAGYYMFATFISLTNNSLTNISLINTHIVSGIGRQPRTIESQSLLGLIERH